MNHASNATNLVELLDQLIEPPELVPISMVPQTWGWVVLGVALLVTLLAAVLKWRNRYNANAYRREALRALEAADNDPATIAQILRRTALVAYPRREVASLAGDDWLGFLDAQLPDGGFQNGPGRAIATAPYTPTEPEIELPKLARRWIRRHRGEQRA